MKPLSRRFTLLIAAAAILTLPIVAIAREKSDVIVLVNGDRITGEILELEYGQLTVKTDSLGTVQIDWLDIARIESRHSFSVESNSGERLSGGISAAPESGHILVAATSGSVELSVSEVSRIGQLEAGFIERLRGSISFGYNQTKSSNFRSVTFGFDTEYRSETTISSLDGNFSSNDTADQGTLSQYSIAFANQFLRPGDKFWLGLALYESNEQQGIDGRLLVGAARGKYLIRKADSEFSTYAGVGVVQEWLSSSAGDTQSVEGILGMQWKVFRFNDPETTLTSRLLVLPSLTETGRYRANADISVRHEFVKDFFLDMSFIGTYDSEPPTLDADSLDYSITTSLGYKF